MSQYKDKIKTYLDSAGVVHTVPGMGEVTFFPVSIAVMFKLRAVIPVVMSSVTALFADNDKDNTQTYRKFNAVSETDPTQGEETISDAQSEAMAALRLKQKQQAIMELSESLIGEKNMTTFAEIIMDSMRDEFPQGNKPPVQDFVSTTPLPLFTEMLIGVAKANKGVFGPLVRQIETALPSIRARIEGKLGSKPQSEANSQNSNPTQQGGAT